MQAFFMKAVCRDGKMDFHENFGKGIPFFFDFWYNRNRMRKSDLFNYRKNAE